jgi:hypothetical protein
MKAWLKAFLAGILLNMSISSLYQDLLGKEGFIKHVESAWVPAGVTIPIAILFFIIAAFLLDDARKGRDSL